MASGDAGLTPPATRARNRPRSAVRAHLDLRQLRIRVQPNSVPPTKARACATHAETVEVAYDANATSTFRDMVPLKDWTAARLFVT